ncbi:MAG: hypothetical protein Q9174_001642 [Haloplaca sp. 1 TL-2023]
MLAVDEAFESPSIHPSTPYRMDAIGGFGGRRMPLNPTWRRPLGMTHVMRKADRQEQLGRKQPVAGQPHLSTTGATSTCTSGSMVDAAIQLSSKPRNGYQAIFGSDRESQSSLKAMDRASRPASFGWYRQPPVTLPNPGHELSTPGRWRATVS